MFRGEYHRADGLIIPNSFSLFGTTKMLQMALRNEDFQFWFGLVKGIPAKTGLKAGLIEPTIGIAGYQRQTIARSNVGWPTIGEFENESFFETDFFTFPAVGNYDQTINRVMFCLEQNSTAGNYVSLSEPLPALLQITAATPLEQRRFKYKVYAG